jgi:hypothetical protein
MVTLIIGIMFLLFTFMDFSIGEFHTRKTSLHYGSAVGHRLTQRTPSPALTPFYRTDECSSA